MHRMWLRRGRGMGHPLGKGNCSKGSETLKRSNDEMEHGNEKREGEFGAY